jgi:multisubunit Na+/H+ antiporter MnhG subunit
MTEEKPPIPQTTILKIVLLFFALLAVLSFIFIPVADLAIVKVFDIFAKLLEVTRGAILVVFGVIMGYYIYNQYRKAEKIEPERKD